MRLSSDSLQALRQLTASDIPEVLLTEAMTHRSAAAETNTPSYDRLEFLGDSVLQLMTTRVLYERFPKKDEGWMTRIRQSLVSQPTLAEIGREMGLDRHVLAGNGAIRTGTPHQDSVLCDVVESLLAAVYLTDGFKAAENFLLPKLEKRLATAGKSAGDTKSRLQERLQRQGTVQIVYNVLSHEGMPPRETFRVEVCCDGVKLAEGTGSSKKNAERDAAAQALENLQGTTN